MTEKEKQAVDALQDCLKLIEDMSRFVGNMALRDYKLFNDAPIKAQSAIKVLSDCERK